ncbi:hypothetical protein EST38_g12578 [Candolleomyces aberdarensis]|uniref:Helicase C-terminal domain-containing protein n=1 Tax=Candolleomyces aberdarensis TaxID=2316362 RepID=A0A4Q2D427_9AGAR|nr:hypothetical protein EST38_g12578 [Candolleomyces aberdarensis]
MWATVDGAPWIYPAWQTRTGVFGGFHTSDDNLLPPGLTKEDVDNILKYLRHLNSIQNEDDKNKFAAGSLSSDNGIWPGRALWNDWIRKKMSGQWRVHQTIAEALSSLSIHPSQIMAEERAFTQKPPGETYIPMALDKIGLELFGPEAMTASGLLRPPLRHLTSLLAARTWENTSRTSLSRASRYPIVRGNALALFDTLDTEKLTKQKLSAAIRSATQWEDLAREFNVLEDVEQVEKIQDELGAMMEALGAKPRRSSTKNALPKAKIQKLKALASSEDVEDLLQEYEAFVANADPEPLMPNVNTLQIAFGESSEGNPDPGVELEAQWTMDRVLQELNFTYRNLPFPFNSYIDPQGCTPWQEEGSRLFRDNLTGNDSRLKPLSFYWHQAVGIHAALRMVFSAERTSLNGNGMLFADEVGLGKTYQSGGIIGFYIELYMRQHSTNPAVTVPQIPGLTFEAGTKYRTSHISYSFPALLCLSGCMSYSLSERGWFWGPDGPIASSKYEPFQTIILAPHSALTQDFNLLYTSKRAKNLKPWDHPEPRPDYSVNKLKTLFHPEYAVAVLDESQNFRNNGAKHSAALRVLEQANIRIILTATPLQTSTKDLAAAGRLANIPYFFSDEIADQLLKDSRALRKAKREKAADESIDDDECPVRELQQNISRRFQEKFGGRVIRRTAQSLDFEGKELISLPKMKIIHAPVRLTEREIKIIEEYIADNEDELTTSGTSAVSRSFYIGHRLGVAYARTKEEKKAHPKIPIFVTITEWELVKGTKIDVCCLICVHFLTSDLAPEVVFVDGYPFFPAIPPSSPVKKTNKIIIYLEFSSLFALLRNILKLRGILSLAIDGQTSYAKRGSIIEEFSTSKTINVLIVSKVGGVGANLSAANYIIFIDQPWSAQDERQIRGRAHRQPQSRVVTCYHLLAAETADIALSSMAGGKKEMLETFLSRPGAIKVNQSLHGDYVPGDFDEDETQAPKRKTSRKPKSLLVIPDSDDEASSVKSKAKPRYRKKGSKKAEVTMGENDDVEESSHQSTKRNRRRSQRTTSTGGQAVLEDSMDYDGRSDGDISMASSAPLSTTDGGSHPSDFASSTRSNSPIIPMDIDGPELESLSTQEAGTLFFSYLLAARIDAHPIYTENPEDQETENRALSISPDTDDQMEGSTQKTKRTAPGSPPSSCYACYGVHFAAVAVCTNRPPPSRKAKARIATVSISTGGTITLFIRDGVVSAGLFVTISISYAGTISLFIEDDIVSAGAFVTEETVGMASTKDSEEEEGSRQR